MGQSFRGRHPLPRPARRPASFRGTPQQVPALARQVAGRRGFRIVGAVDVDPAKAGRDLGEVVELGRRVKVTVSDDLRRAVRKEPA